MADKRLQGTKVLFIIAPEQFRDEELLEPQRILSDAGAEVKVASTRAGVAEGMLGAKITPDTLVEAESASLYDAIVVVGGMGSPEHLWDNKKVHEILRQGQKEKKIVAGICLSGAVLAKAGVLSGKKATVWATPESTAALAEGKAQYVPEHVVVDGNTVTADGPEAAADFARALSLLLEPVAARV